MKTILHPGREEWPSLCKRPRAERSGLELLVSEILEMVRKEGDKALYYYSEKFDGVTPGTLKVTPAEIEKADAEVSAELKAAISLAITNIEKFHQPQLTIEEETETTKGVRCWRKNIPLERAGLYIPGGTAPLFSTVLMLAIPARLAGCKEIILCTPPGKNGEVDRAILYAASLAGVTSIFKTGGAQAIAAMAYGTESIPRVDKIFGPGNQYVTKAKEMVQLDGIAIDLPAGPSELVVIGDKDSDPRFIASDLISQAEHGPDSQVIFLTDSKIMITRVKTETESQLSTLPRSDIAMKALENCLLILFKSLDECMEFSNDYAPEHLIIATGDPYPLAEKVVNAGSVFLGKFSCESAGDYASGTNHTLPTSGAARSTGGVSAESFVRKITFQEISPEGLSRIGPAIETMATAEQLEGHRNAVSIRLKSLGNE